MLRHVQPAGQTGFRDRYDRRASDWFTNWKAGLDFDIGLLGVPLSKTSISHSAAFRFPAAVRTALGACTTYHLSEDLDVADTLRAVDLGDVAMHVTDLSACHQRTKEAIYDYWLHYPETRLFVLGGDHSITAPSVQALCEALSRPIGVVHFDAHHDVRNLEDGGPTNGTPFRTLLESKTIEGRRLIQIGLRNFSNAREYSKYVRAQGGTVVPMEDVWKRGIEDIVADALHIAGADNAAIYASFDLDVLDPNVAPGVPAPVPGGLTFREAAAALRALGASKHIMAIDFVCADPSMDARDLSARAAAHLLLYAAVGIAQGVQPT